MTSIASSPLRSLRLIAADIKLAHSVFAMPFALLAAFMAAPAPLNWPRFGGQLVLIVLAMIFARTAAMLANRVLDRHIDQRNPRTAGRAIPSSKLSLGSAVLGWAISALLFMSVCGWLGAFYGNWWPLILGLPVLLWISAYALFKRFSALCHLYLGSSLALSPIAAAIAINPNAVVEQPALWLLSGMVLCWVAGFDIIYALQDVAVDRRDGLHSIPAQFGIPGSLWISRSLHATAVACLVASLILDERFGLVFGAGCAVVTALLIYEHRTVSRWGTTKIALAFFTLNGVISCVLGALGIVDVLL